MIQAHVKALNSSSLLYCSFSGNSLQQPSSQQSALFAKMALLSNQKQWLLFTAQAPRPLSLQLDQFNVCCDRIIHMKSSQYMTEIETVEKAILSGNASAIVASGSIDRFSQRYLEALAKKHSCEVFFIDSLSPLMH